MCALVDVSLALANLDGAVLCDDAGARAWRVKQNPVHVTQHLGKLSAVVVAHRRVGATHALEIGDERGESLLLKLIREDHPCVSHQRGEVGCLTSWRRCDIEDALAVLRARVPCTGGTKVRDWSM